MSVTTAMVGMFGDVPMQDLSGKITATDWIDLVEQMRRKSFSDHTLARFRGEVDKGNNFIELPQKVAKYDFGSIGIELQEGEREQLKMVMQTLIMHAAHIRAHEEVERINQWKKQQEDCYKRIWSQLHHKIDAPAAE